MLPFANIFIHNKIYVIDNQIAYLGSMNLTSNGMSSNVETRIRISDIGIVSGLDTYVEA